METEQLRRLLSEWEQENREAREIRGRIADHDLVRRQPTN